MQISQEQKEFIIFKGFLVIRNCPRRESGSLNKIDVMLNGPETQFKSDCTEKMKILNRFL